MYGNGVAVADVHTSRGKGYLDRIVFRTGDDAADLFRYACRSCHTIDGYHPLAPALGGTNPEFIAAIVRGTDLLAGNMPPFPGSDGEAELLAGYVWDRVEQRPLDETAGLEGLALGEAVFDVWCGRCHVFGGFRDNHESLVGLEPEDYEDIFDNGGDYGDGMPDFTGTDAERAALVAYLSSLGSGGDVQ
jgi:mono/diheme cytochrome c family protein